MEQSVKKQFEDYIKLIEQKLDEFLPVKYPQEIWESMRYSVLAGGKRLRPMLCLETCKVLSDSYEQAIPTDRNAAYSKPYSRRLALYG